MSRINKVITRFSSSCSRAENISKIQVIELIKAKSAYLVDVRSEEEATAGCIPTSRHIPLDELSDALSLSKEEFKYQYGFDKMEKDAHIVFYCRSGARARQALFLAKNKGFYNIQNFTGGWLSWADRSVCSKQDVEAVVNNAAPNCHLIDVRDHTEVAHGVIPTAKHLPIKEMIEAFRLPASEFKERYGFEKFDPAENLIFYCKRGWRSEAACYIAKKFGYKNGRNYKGSWNEWTSTDSSSGAAV